MKSSITRRDLLKGAAMSAGAISLLNGSFGIPQAMAQEAFPKGSIHSFEAAGVKFHTYVSPAPAVSVTSHVVELGDQLLVADATMLPPTAGEVAALIGSLGKPVHTAYLSHEHPDHWGGVSTLSGINFATLPQIRAGVAERSKDGQFPVPTSVLEGGDIQLGATNIGGVPVEFRNYEMNEAPNMLVAVFPEQKVAIVQDLVYNGVFFAPGVDRKNWIKTLETLRDDPAFDTLLVGHGVPTTRGEFSTAITYIQTLDAAWDAASSPQEVIAAMKAAYPDYSGDFLLSLAERYWDK